MQDFDFILKFLLIGNTSVGKSSLLLRFSENTFEQNFLPTIGVDFKTRTFSLDKKTLKIQIWDTAGQERFKNITSSYYKGAHGVILVYDITNKRSFDDLEIWVGEIEKNSSDNALRILLGNKNDLSQKRVIDNNEGFEFAKKNKMDFIETSAKNSSNVEKAFFNLAKKVVNKIEMLDEANVDFKNGTAANLDGINLLSEPDEKDNKCCNFL